jgi:glycosyltransferase involved in cell wall biosynthesis
MNILYVSFFSGSESSGPTYSVPQQIFAQSEFDQVFWYSMENSKIDCWRKYEFYHNLNDYPEQKISRLPAPFHDPDLIIYEGFYYSGSTKIIAEAIKRKIPYIFVPRCSLTEKAQSRKRLKKIVANWMKFYNYASHAAAIQYLTVQEHRDSGEKWNQNAIIIPNGIEEKKIHKQSFSNGAIRCVAIGRIEPFQKGYDLLVSACIELKEKLMEKGCTISIYGPDQEGKVESLKAKLKEHGMENVISFHDGVYGDEKQKILMESDVFMMPSRFEGHPMSLIEALAYGLPCVVTTGSNMKDEVDSYQAGWTADSDVESLKAALEKMLVEYDSSVGKMSENAIQLSKKYNWSSIASDSHKEYEKIIEGK